jgi:hypothetical protein
VSLAATNWADFGQRHCPIRLDPRKFRGQIFFCHLMGLGAQLSAIPLTADRQKSFQGEA